MNMPTGLTRNNAKNAVVVSTKATLPISSGDKSVVATRIIASASKNCAARPKKIIIKFCSLGVFVVGVLRLPPAKSD